MLYYTDGDFGGKGVKTCAALRSYTYMRALYAFAALHDCFHCLPRAVQHFLLTSTAYRRRSILKWAGAGPVPESGVAARWRALPVFGRAGMRTKTFRCGVSLRVRRQRRFYYRAHDEENACNAVATVALLRSHSWRAGVFFLASSNSTRVAAMPAASYAQRLLLLVRYLMLRARISLLSSPVLPFDGSFLSSSLLSLPARFHLSFLQATATGVVAFWRARRTCFLLRLRRRAQGGFALTGRAVCYFAVMPTCGHFVGLPGCVAFTTVCLCMPACLCICLWFLGMVNSGRQNVRVLRGVPPSAEQFCSLPSLS